jgi:LmbE family N-acetylglucosaminyl deacetylase
MTHRVPALLYFHLSFCPFLATELASLIVDISDTLQQKLDSIARYQSQFPPEKSPLFDRVRAFAQQ